MKKAEIPLKEKIMNFLFGKNFPIFNSKGKIEHKTDKSHKAWEERYIKDENYSWRNHSGTVYKK